MEPRAFVILRVLEVCGLGWLHIGGVSEMAAKVLER